MSVSEAKGLTGTRKPRSARRAGTGVTMLDVAKRAGVSQMTVSFVVHGTKNVTPATYEAVREAIEALGYVPNQTARRLASANDLRIGLLYSTRPNAFLSALLVGVLNAASRLGLQIHIEKFHSSSAEPLCATIQRLAAGGANALLLPSPISEYASLQRIHERYDMPIVAVAPGGSLAGIRSVRIDERQAAYDIISLLFDHGHHRIGFIKGPDVHSSSTARLEGYRAAHVQRGIAVDEELIVPGDFEFESGLEGARVLLDRADRPTAIFASNDAMASGVTATAHRRGLDLPRELSIAGFDDTPIATQIWPTLTTIGRDVTAMAERGVEMLAEMARARAAGKPVAAEDIFFGYYIAKRDSVGTHRL